jgi:hypothetical protein
VAGVVEKMFFLVVARSPQLKEDLLRRFDRIHEKSFRQSSASTNRMEESIRVVGKETSREEYKAFKRDVCYVMYELFGKIVEPICKLHPSLKPPGMEDSKCLN